MHDHLINHPAVLAIFGVTVVIMLLLDLGVFNKNSHVVSNKEALTWSVVWISLSMIFSGVIYFVMDFDAFAKFQSAYWIEKALSVDNLFVFIMVFGFFNVPKHLHHKVLFWGIIGALVFRAIFIFTGVELINLTYLPEINILGQNVRINVILSLFGFFLIFAGIKSWSSHEDEDENKDFSKSPGAKIIYRFFKVTKNFEGDRFFIKENGIRLATPLLVVVAVIEFTDLIFAVDSIPAIFAIAPNDPFILYTSNIFAILGLRALYFLLANFMYMFSKLHYGLALILAFIGIKMLISPFVHISSPMSLAVVGGILLGAVVVSFMFPAKDGGK
ncbi:TerC/Alx family metal homeostasis membrane protein [Flavobacterium zepuense]|uniref:TerC/Alx family metal homeostasis membrane protein n=1 Tax=Flavobacterium zepuense TaxID=2593302 RepID=A0A552UWY5_9FLAO|nr:TerC/Alx family metal homeostasis membrane protein [Flavobacterium zepuense]TRW22726.1 TerC/Alx family metal homeostasis membrane protein [Flavobacterium zepuense]